MSIQDALSCLKDIETAVAEGDFETANVAAQDLHPLLINARADELVALRERVDNLKLGVIARRAADGETLKTLQQKRDGAAVYRTLARVY